MRTATIYEKGEEMKRLVIIFAIVVLIAHAIGAFAQPPDTLWTRTFGGSAADVGYSVQQADDGGCIITGYTDSFGAGGEDVYLIKTDGSGNAEWARSCGGIGNDEGQSVQQTTDGGYIIAGYTMSYGAGGYDVFLIKTDASGNEEWTQTCGGTGTDVGYSVQQTSDGGYIIAGYTESFGAGGKDVYLIKTDASGNEEWAQTHGGTGNDVGRSVQQTPDGGYIIAGDTYSYGAGGNVYLIKTDASGNSLWFQNYGGTSTDYGYSVQQTSDGGYIIVGYTISFSGHDVYLIKTDASGDTLWTRTYGGSSIDHGYSVQQTDDGGYVIAGYTASYGAGFYDVYLVKTDAAGNEEWSQTYGGTSTDYGWSIQQTTDGGCIIAGYTSSYGAGGSDVYLIRLEGEAPPDLSVTLAPHDPPIIIPANGGSFLFDVAIENTTASPITADAWIEAIPPGGTAIPLMVRTGITFPASATITRPDLTQNVPAGAPPGIYTYMCSVGEYLVSTIDFDQFIFEKLAGDGGLSTVKDWNLSGWKDGAKQASAPVEFSLSSARPNPFNPITAIRYELPKTSFMNLSIYDVSGRLVATLVNGWRDVGAHEITFDGSGLASGLYFYRIKAGDFTTCHKMILMK